MDEGDKLMGSVDYSTKVEIKPEKELEHATELEFLKYVYDNMPVEDLWDLEEGFKADTMKELPVGYESSALLEQGEAKEFWDKYNDDHDCKTCPNLSKCNKDEE